MTCVGGLQSASCMAVSRDGRHALLASRRLLVLVDLQQPEHHLRALSWQSKYDAGSAAWSRAPAQGGADLAVTVSVTTRGRYGGDTTALLKTASRCLMRGTFPYFSQNAAKDSCIL